jgi:hypothetical protein
MSSAMRARSRVTLLDGRRLEVGIAPEPLERLLEVGSPGRIGLHDERACRWVWLELSEVSDVAPVTDVGAPERESAVRRKHIRQPPISPFPEAAP